MEETMSDVLVIGASILDIKGRLTEQPIPNSSNYASIKMSIGGVARNIAENLARLGADARLLTAIGDDYAGEEMSGNAEEVGMDISRALMIDGESTATYLAALDQTGDLLLGLDDTDIMRHITPEYLRKNEDAFEDCEMVVLDLNLTDAALDEAIKTARQYGKKIVVDPTSTQRAVRLKKHLADLDIITPNMDEAAAILGRSSPNTPDDAIAAARALVGLGVGVAVITQAEQGACYATEHEWGHFPALNVQIVDTTGAGDALTAAIVFGMLNNLSVADSVRLGLNAASLTLRTSETVSSELSLDQLYGMDETI
ncbi:MAG TPA: carbohydrate kinase family protein, partial [Thermoflexales bacterium]|nr:carbohydrate kinase family protein [Thermoflexales bacterium]